MSGRSVYPHGSNKLHKGETGWRKLKYDTSKELRGILGNYQKTLGYSREWYSNVRAQRGFSSGLPTYIFNDARFKDYGFSVSWLPPKDRGFSITRPGWIRRWEFLAFHSFGSSYDVTRLHSHRGLISIPTDEYGHNPRRFYAAMKYLTDWTRGSRVVGIHFGVSRRGDIATSVDLNDTAFATGGVVKVGFNYNRYSIGFELEVHEARFIPDSTKRTSRIYRQPFSERQILSLAVAIRKLDSWRPGVINITWLSTPSEIRAAHVNKTGGCFQHWTLHPKKRTDPGAQFNIPAGTRARFGSSMWNGTGTRADNGPGEYMESGWDQLKRAYDSVRPVDLATECFVTPVTSVGASLAAASVALSHAHGAGQRGVVQAGRGKLAALARSESMQQQTRKSVYATAMYNNKALTSFAGRTAAASSRMIDAYDTSSVKGVTGATMFNEKTGLWEDGEA